jgi:hypothetical protein
MTGALWIRMNDGRLPNSVSPKFSEHRWEIVEIGSKSGRIPPMKAFPARTSTQQKVPGQKYDSRTSGESAGLPKLFADTEHTAKLFNETSGRLDIRSVAELYDLSISELARMINVEAKTAHKTPDSAAIHKGLIPFEEVARTLSLMRCSVPNFRRWLNASNAELNYRKRHAEDHCSR